MLQQSAPNGLFQVTANSAALSLRRLANAAAATGAAEQISLPFRARLANKIVPLFPRFDAFRKYQMAEAFSHADDRAHDR